MNISSGKSIGSIIAEKFLDWFYLWIIIAYYCYILAMHYGELPAESIYMFYVGVARLIFANMYYSLVSKELLQQIEDEPFETVLSRHMILGPISVLVSVWGWFILLSGAMVGWGWFILTAICIDGLINVHKKRKNIVKKKKVKEAKANDMEVKEEKVKEAKAINMKFKNYNQNITTMCEITDINKSI